jgi:hypothetical protein
MKQLTIMAVKHSMTRLNISTGVPVSHTTGSHTASCGVPEPYCLPPMTTFQRRGMEMGTLQRDDVVLHFQATGSGASHLVEGAEVEATRRNLGQLLRARFTGLETGRSW